MNQIFEQFPHWKELLTLRQDKISGTAFIEFNLAAPSNCTERGLWVSTEDEQISVGLGNYHTHFRNWDGEAGSRQIAQALDFVKQLLDELVVTSNYYVGDTFVASTAHAAGTSPSSLSHRSDVSRIVTKSWRGTHDRDCFV